MKFTGKVWVFGDDLNTDAMYPGYGFASHVGYITQSHTREVRERGPCEIHRRSFRALCYTSEPGPQARER